MNDKEKNIKNGFIKDTNNVRLKKVLKDNAYIKEIYIDLYSMNPLFSSPNFMLLLRTCENDITVSNNGNRIIFEKNDKYRTNVINVLYSEISECYVKSNDNWENCFDFVIRIRNIYYRMVISKR